MANLNTQAAYMAARHRQALEQADRAPWAQYLAVMDHRTAHAALHGKVFRLDSAAWAVISPPNGYLCRCRARYFSDRELKNRGLTPEEDVRIVERDPPGNKPENWPPPSPGVNAASPFHPRNARGSMTPCGSIPAGIISRARAKNDRYHRHG